MQIKTVLDKTTEQAKGSSAPQLPKRAHATDAGADLFCTEDLVVPAHGNATARTGVHVQLPSGTCGLLVSKSGLNVRHDVTSTGLIDEGFTGEILVRLHNHGDEDYHLSAGDKVSQMLVLPYAETQFVEVDHLDESERGDAGYGSTGR